MTELTEIDIINTTAPRPMRRLRLSIAQIMLLVLLIGLAIGVLRSPSPLLARVTWTSTAALLCWAIVAAIFRPVRHRAFWSGFAVFGWVHLVLIFELYRLHALNPDLAPPPSLLTSDLIEYLWQHLTPHPAVRVFNAVVTRLADNFSYREFVQIARSLMTLLVALIGGGLGCLAAGCSSPLVPPKSDDVA